MFEVQNPPTCYPLVRSVCGVHLVILASGILNRETVGPLIYLRARALWRALRRGDLQEGVERVGERKGGMVRNREGS